MNKLIETAKELDRILKSGIEIHPNSPIHEKLQRALKIPHVVGRSKQSFCVVCGEKYSNPNQDSDTCYNCREPHAK